MDWASLLLMITTAWKVSKYGVFSGPYFPAFGLNTGKNRPKKTRIWTLFSDRRKHDYKSNRENKKGDDNKKEKEIQKR